MASTGYIHTVTVLAGYRQVDSFDAALPEAEVFADLVAAVGAQELVQAIPPAVPLPVALAVRGVHLRVCEQVLDTL